MKRLIFLTLITTLIPACSEKTEASLKVLRERAENKLVATAGEAEVAMELYRNQYAAFKERLVRMRSLHSLFSEELEHAYASNDVRKIKIYEDRVKYLSVQIPKAEQVLIEFYQIYQTQKQEIRYIKDITATYRAVGMVSETESVINEYEKRGDSIKELTRNLKMKLHHAKSVVEQNEFEESSVIR